MCDYEVVIIGAGPAGSTLARMLPKHIKTAVIDRKNDTPQSFRKPCGGLLAPDSQKTLGRLGLSVPKEILVTPQIFAVDTIDIGQNLQRYYQRFYLNIDRHKFDLWLMSLIPDCVDRLYDSFCSKIERTSSGYRIEYISGGETKTITTKYVVGADGAKSSVRKIIDAPPIRQYLSIQKSYKTNAATPYYICFFDQKITDCYGWINAKDDIIELGGAFDVKTAKVDFEQAEKIFRSNRYNIGDLVGTQACLVSRPKAVSEIFLGQETAFLIGEAAGFISTSSLEGISFAMDSGVALAQAFENGGNVLSGYKKRTRGLKFKIFGKIIKSPAIYNPFLRKIVMKSGLTSFKSLE